MKSRLGKGLSELFDENSILDILESETSSEINIEDIVANPYQPRRVFDQKQLEELADSIKEHGVVTPIIVVLDKGNYVVIAGERRLRACKLAGIKTIPAIIRDYTDAQMMEIALLENIQREDLTPIEIAVSYKNIIDRLGLTQAQLSKRVGKSRSQITNMVGLLSLPKQVQEMVDTGILSMGHARVLSKIKNPDRVLQIAKQIKEQNMSVRDVEALSREEDKKVRVVRKIVNEFADYEKQLEEILQRKVSVKSGKISIKFNDKKDLAEIINKLK